MPANSETSGWHDTHTFHLGQFDLDALYVAKQTQGLSVSVVLPAKDEAPTLAGMVEAVAELSDTLVDEVVVMDASSEDGSAQVAAAAGARVHDDSQVLAEHGRCQGKGDALWRSLAVTSGDVVAFVDSDITNPSPAFVVGLLGPLILDPAIQLTKAFYDRPLVDDAGHHGGQGGRVTELLARPLLNLFWPPLAGLVQPLAGEYAARRGLLERIPFFTGYGVELGVLVDTLGAAGIDAIAQCDVGERRHGHQPLDALSRMSYAILQVALRRLDSEGRLDLAKVLGGLDVPDRYVQFSRGADHRPHPVHHGVEIIERPPFVSRFDYLPEGVSG